MNPKFTQMLSEKLSWAKYLKEVGIDQKEFKKLDPHKYQKFQKLYSKHSVEDFETNYGYLDAMQDEASKIRI
ncbi:MAG: hypothetical protein KAR20_06535 [Candidatus Heimdallarchaeota archaeon]|nr:hypothetical protein [Candidatus Heimdallarchaeota archaeon]